MHECFRIHIWKFTWTTINVCSWQWMHFHEALAPNGFPRLAWDNLFRAMSLNKLKWAHLEFFNCLWWEEEKLPSVLVQSEPPTNNTLFLCQSSLRAPAAQPWSQIPALGDSLNVSELPDLGDLLKLNHLFSKQMIRFISASRMIKIFLHV